MGTRRVHRCQVFYYGLNCLQVIDVAFERVTRYKLFATVPDPRGLMLLPAIAPSWLDAERAFGTG